MERKKRTEKWFNRTSCGAVLRTVDRATEIYIKLLENGSIAMDIFRDGQRYHRELSPECSPPYGADSPVAEKQGSVVVVSDR